MKRCKFCAEEIQDAAIFCRYCGRRVKINLRRIIINTLIITALMIFAGTHRMQISRAYYNAKISIGQFRSGCREFLDYIRLMPENMRAMRERNNQISYVIDDVLGESSRSTNNSPPSEW